MDCTFYIGSYDPRYCQNPTDYIENYAYLYKVKIIEKNKLQVLSVLHDITIPIKKDLKVVEGCIFKYKMDFNLNGDFMYQIETLKNPYINWSESQYFRDDYYNYNPDNHQIVCLKTLRTIQENIINSNAILSEK